MDDQNLIPSFQVDHNKLKPGVYVSRVDDVGGGHYVTTFDVRFVCPNKDRLSEPAMHSIEHLGATILRNSEEYSNKLIYWGNMGCATGFYAIVKGKKSAQWGAEMVKFVMNSIICWKGKVPGTNKINCGNYKMHDLIDAKNAAYAYLGKKWCHEYPMTERLTVKGVGAFHDS